MKLLRRKIDNYLKEWKSDKERMPLIVKGARQVGKTASILQFAHDNYQNVVAINFVLQQKYKAIFEEGYEVDSIIRNLTLINPSLKIEAGNTLIFFDEMQDCPACATSLKAFKIDGRYDVICSGSLMGINYREIESNSVGYKEDYTMHSMDFEEFLWAKGYDFATDVVVLVFVKLGNKPKDKDHDYGHGKYETLATAIIGISLFVVGVMICYSGVTKTYRAICGETLQQPGVVALIAAIVSIVMKEWAYQFTVKAGRKYHSEAVVANTWHHRSDALSSIGTMFGIGGAIILGEKWAVLDPLAAIIVSAFIIKAAWGLVMQSVKELTDASLPETEEDEILKIANEEQGVGEIHNLRTRRIGNKIAVEMHIRMPGSLSLYEAHEHATHIETKLKQHFGADTHVGIHLEPIKVNGKYQKPE
jgi:cation diffusion facilitator family transporter